MVLLATPSYPTLLTYVLTQATFPASYTRCPKTFHEQSYAILSAGSKHPGSKAEDHVYHHKSKIETMRQKPLTHFTFYFKFRQISHIISGISQTISEKMFLARQHNILLLYIYNIQLNINDIRPFLLHQS